MRERERERESVRMNLPVEAGFHLSSSWAFCKRINSARNYSAFQVTAPMVTSVSLYIYTNLLAPQCENGKWKFVELKTAGHSFSQPL
jgi:hypothetical protein